ncbi:MAG TPA: alpha/beta hydrolase [Candidatus Caenarcaniphilales bacterium]
MLERALLLGVSACLLLQSPPATAAQRVVMKYGTFRSPMSVGELNQFAATGKSSAAFDAYLKASQQDPALARKGLTAGLKANPAFLDRLLNGWTGPILLNQLGQVIHHSSGQADDAALRSALTLSIKRDGKVTLLRAIQNYPAPEVIVEGDRIVPVYERLSLLSQLL